MQNITFFNAGAGSGKTYKLTDTLLQLISEGKCNADELIITTFTKAAAAEIESRIREKLFEKGLYNQALLLNNALIGTVHAVALEILKKYWYVLGHPVQPAVMPPEDVTFVINQALANVPQQSEVLRLNEIAEQFNFSTFNGQIAVPDLDRWRDDVTKLVEIALAYQIDDLNPALKESLKILNQVYPPANFTFTTQDYQLLLNDCLAHFDTEKQTDANDKRIKEAKSLLRQTGNSYRFLNNLQKFLSALPAKASKAVPKIDTFNTELASAYRSAEGVSMAAEYINLVFKLAAASLEQLSEYKLNANLIDYNDMERFLLQLLQEQLVKSELKGKYKYIFVDEFQDSSPIQVQIFSRLSGLVQHSFWVGDPKQSIYNFRGSDPLLIQHIISLFSKQNEAGLSINNDLVNSWRSRPPLVKLTNYLFTDALADQVAKPEMIPLIPKRPANELPANNENIALRIWPIPEDNRETQYKTLAYYIKNLLSENRHIIDKTKSDYSSPGKSVSIPRKLNPGDVAVLHTTNFNVSKTADFLQQIGIRVSSVSDGITQTAEFRLFLAMLRLMLNEQDLLARSEVLLLNGDFNNVSEMIDDRLGFLKKIDEEIDKELPDADDETKKKLRLAKQFTWQSDAAILAQLAAVKKQLIGLDIPAIVDTLMIRSGIHNIVKRWPDYENRLINLDNMRAFSSRYNERCNTMNLAPSLPGFIVYLQNIVLPKDAEINRNNQAVNVLTYHKAKGLEWPVVILNDLSDDFNDDHKLIRKELMGVTLIKPDNINPADILKGYQPVLIPDLFGSKKKFPEELTLRISNLSLFQQLKKDRVQEAKRLLYVAFTRARDFLILSPLLLNELKWLNLITNTTDFQDQIATEEPIAFKAFNTDVEAWIETPPETSHSDDAVPESVHNAWSYVLPSDNAADALPKFVSPSMVNPVPTRVKLRHDFNHRITLAAHHGLSDSDIGDLLHAIFYHYNHNGSDEQFLEITRRLIQNHEAEKNFPAPESVIKAIRNLYSQLISDFGKPSKIYKELPLQLAHEGQVFRGEIDLLFETENGLILIDYKSYPGSINNVLSENTDHYAGKYSGQLATYHNMIEQTHPGNKKVLHKFIYYAVLGILVELV
ncbi:MAG: ATP-dependent helicase/nuclease subunit [Bacteroidales bacterium]|nr:ATP-dependent helicase/nuclease subunit [Bacteroidales bacterium]